LGTCAEPKFCQLIGRLSGSVDVALVGRLGRVAGQRPDEGAGLAGAP